MIEEQAGSLDKPDDILDDLFPDAAPDSAVGLIKGIKKSADNFFDKWCPPEQSIDEIHEQERGAFDKQEREL